RLATLAMTCAAEEAEERQHALSLGEQSVRARCCRAPGAGRPGRGFQEWCCFKGSLPYNPADPVQLPPQVAGPAAPGTPAPCWRECDAGVFVVRNIRYKLTQEKVPSGFALYDCVGMDLICDSRRESTASWTGLVQACRRAPAGPPSGRRPGASRGCSPPSTHSCRTLLAVGCLRTLRRTEAAARYRGGGFCALSPVLRDAGPGDPVSISETLAAVRGGGRVIEGRHGAEGHGSCGRHGQV
ncbi:unnamed protein product, partial [Prorocentrum cordatum]